ncbi:MAG: hypothetical protein ACKO1J_00790 [Tagaea sp.]
MADHASALDERLNTLNADLDDTAERRSAAIVAGNTEEAKRLDAECAGLERDIAATMAARAAVDEAAVHLLREAEEAEHQAVVAKLKKLCRTARQRAKELNDAMDAVGAATLALREATKDIWEASDGPTRCDELSELPRLLASLSAVQNERLAFHHVLPSRMPLLDRSLPPPCIEAHLSVCLDRLAPGPGRPKKPGEEPVDAHA